MQVSQFHVQVVAALEPLVRLLSTGSIVLHLKDGRIMEIETALKRKM